MNRCVLKIGMLVAVDRGDSDIEMVCENFYARLSELVQSEDHMMDCTVEGFPLPGNQPVTGEPVTA